MTNPPGTGPQELQKHALTLDEGFRLAMQLHQQGRLAEAKAIYASILKVMPEHPETLHFFGLLLHQSGDSEQGIELIQRALASSQEYTDAFNNLGNIYRVRNQTQLAEQAYRRVIELEPDHPGALNNLAGIYNEQGRLPEALETYQSAARAAPDNADVRYNLGNVFSKQERWEEAEEAYRLAIESKPEHAAAHRARGKALTRLQRHDEALVAWQRAAELNADHAWTHCELGNSLQIKGLLEDAVAAYLRAIALKPDCGEAYEQAAIALYRLDRLEDAGALVRRWLNNEPQNPIARHTAAAILNEQVPERASDDYIRATFDSFADSFDSQLERLQYAAPSLLVQQLAGINIESAGRLSVLDAGCGTGLCGPLLRPYAKQLIGVDLSGRMLQRAARRGVYDELNEVELTAYMQQHPLHFDLILSADTLVYFGELDDVLAATAGTLRTGGWLVFSVEQGSAEKGFAIGPHGRYNHSDDYVRTILERSGFTRISLSPAVLRTEGSEPVNGWLVLAAKV